jgi:carbamoyl-phosphate synthase small subunit
VKGSLLLENGRQFEGEWRGSVDGDAVVGEVVFNTSMTGYQEILTDPSYAGQIVTMTYPEIGNYGTNSDDVESKSVHCRDLIVREISEIQSNFTSEQTLEAYLIEHKISCLSELDTRALTRQLRETGAMKGTFLKDGESVEEGMKRIEAFQYQGVDHSARVTGHQSGDEYTTSGQRPKVAVLDFGIKSNILRLISAYADCDVFSVANFPVEKKDNYDGFFLSNGPGDPADVKGAVELIQTLLSCSKPIFGICLGHQLLSLALGGSTYKLKFGHHGANHPVKNMLTDKVEISSQNHGFAVDPDSFPSSVEVQATHINLNDGSLAGLQLKHDPVYSIQYHPEASPGPRDAEYLFAKFKQDLGA